MFVSNLASTTTLDGSSLKIGIVQARFNEDITNTLREACVAELKAMGVADDRIEMLAEMATADPSAGTNPIPVGVKEHRTLLEMSFAGRLA